jgi:CheY-like chemotaxis protein
MRTDPVDILYVEDDEADAEFADLAIRSGRECNRIKLHVVSDGEEAAKFLGIYDSKATPQGISPSIILLDLNIPRIHGKELLRRIKKTDRLSKTPVVILSTSEHRSEIDEMFSLGAAGYFVKPAGLEAYRGIFQAICSYWVSRGQLPKVS